MSIQKIIYVNEFNDIAIQKVINSALPGQIITFQPGIYNITKPIILKSNMTYRGRGTILNSTNKTVIFLLHSSRNNVANNITIDNIKFDNGGIDIEGVSTNETTLDFTSMGNNIKITDCIFGKFSGKNSLGMITLTYLNNILVSNNNFENNKSNSIFGFHNKSLMIIGNKFQNCNQALYHGGIELNGGNNFVISYNFLNNTQRMGFEFQGYFPGLIISNNNMIDWSPMLNKTPGQSHSCAMSLGCDNSPNININNNVINGAPQNVLGVAIEIVAPNSMVENNKISNVGTAFLIGNCPDTVFQNNVISDLLPNLKDVHTSGAFSKNGGYKIGEKILSNTVNGKVVVGTNWNWEN